MNSTPPLPMPAQTEQIRVRRRTFSAKETFYRGVLVWWCVVVSLWTIGWSMARFIPPTKADPGVAALFAPWAAKSLFPEPDERRMYVVLTLLSPLLILAAWALLRRFSFPRREGAVGTGFRWWERLPFRAVPMALLIAGIGAASIRLGRTTPVIEEMFRLAGPHLRALAAGVLVLWLVLLAWRVRRRRVAKLWSGLALTGSLALAVAGGIALRVFDYHSADGTNAAHLNTVLYPIVQAATGRHMLVDYLLQYGGYGEMLKPFFAVFGLSVFHITLLLAVVQCLSYGVIVWTFSRLLRSGWLLLLSVGVLAWLPMFEEATPGGKFEPYYQYFPVRVLFPALSILAAWGYLRRPSIRRAVAVGVLGGLGAWWNVDTGVVTLASLLGLLAVELFTRWNRPPIPGEPRRGLPLLAACAGAAVTLGGFYLWLCLEAHQWINLAAALRYQSIFYVSGFFMSPMPSALDLWHLLIAVYLLALTFGLGRALTRRSLGVGHGMMVYLGVLGIGLFSYYQGRSDPHVLTLCCWPGVLLALLLSDRLLAAVRYRLLPGWTALAALPALTLAAACALCLWQAREKIIAVDRGHWHLAPPATASSLHDVPAEVAYIKRVVHRGESCAIISPFQSIYYAATGLPSALRGQSAFECMLKSDVDDTCRQIGSRRAPHVLTEYKIAPFDGTDAPYGPEFFRVLSNAYHLVSASPDNLVQDWQPRADSELGTNPGEAFQRDFEHRLRLTISPRSAHHAVSFASPGLLLDNDGRFVTSPYPWYVTVMGDKWAFEVLATPAATEPVNACLLSTHPGAHSDGFVVQQVGGVGSIRYAAFFGTGKVFVNSQTFPLTPGREHYLAVTCTAGVVTVFVDGNPLPPVVLGHAMTESNLPLFVADWVSNNRRFNGEVSEVKMHTQALSPEIIASTEAKLTSNTGP